MKGNTSRNCCLYCKKRHISGGFQVRPTRLGGRCYNFSRELRYILTSTNILLYSQKVENQHTKLNKIVIPKNLRVSYENFAAYKVDNSEKALESLLDEESHMINTNYIDEVSSITNSELDELITMEIDE